MAATRKMEETEMKEKLKKYIFENFTLGLDVKMMEE